MTNIIYDYILDELRLQDTSSVPDPLFVNNLGVRSLASINTLNVNQVFSSTATIGNVGLNNLQWNLTAGATTFVEGQMSYDANQQTTVLGMAGGNVNLALGMETLFPRRVRNSTGSTMPKGTAVYINGVSGNTPTIDRAIATGDQTSAYTIGLTAESIDDSATGWVATFGELTGIDLSAFTGGDTLYLSGVSAGLFTNTPQLAPFHYVRLGTVVKATSDGALVVNVINGFETNEIHDIELSSLASGHILISNGSLWQNKSLDTVNSYLSLSSLAVRNNLNFYELVSYPSLGSLSVRNTLNFTDLVSYPSLGSLSIRNNLNFYELVSYPSLGSLSIRNSINFSEITGVTLTSSVSGNILISNGSLWQNKDITDFSDIAFKSQANIFSEIQTIEKDQANAEYRARTYRTTPSAGFFRAQKARGSLASPAVLLPNDLIGGFIGDGYTGTNFIAVSQINIRSAGSLGSLGLPGKIELATSDGNSAVATRVTVDQTGNVGIGTTTPSNFNGISFGDSILDVNGVIQVRGDTTNNAAVLQFGGDTYRKANIYSPVGTDSPYLAFGVANSGSTSSATERVRILSDGNVGIGETSPLGKLHIIAPQNAIVLEKSLASAGAVGPFMYVQDNGQTSAGVNSSEFGFFVAGVGSSNSNQGPYFLMRGSTFSRIANQRGHLNFSAAGNISNASGRDGSITFSTGNSERLAVLPNGNVGIGTITPEGSFTVFNTDVNKTGQVIHHAGGTNDYLRVLNQTTGATIFEIDPAGRVGVGKSPASWLTSYNVMQVRNSAILGSTDANHYFSNNYFTDTSGVNRYLSTGGAGLVGFTNGVFEVYGAVSGLSGASLSIVRTAQLGINRTLALQGATSQTGTGISFPTTFNSSTDANTLDDYEEGNFTPIVRGSSVAGTGTYTTQNGRYTKVGRVVHYEGYVVWTNLSGASGSLLIGGLPFSSASTNTFAPVTLGYVLNVTLPANSVLTAYVRNAETNISLQTYPLGGGANTNLALDTAGSLIFGGSYTTTT